MRFREERVFWIAGGCLLALLFGAGSGARATVMNAPRVQAGAVRFEFDSVAGELFLVERTAGMGARWLEVERFRGTGAILGFAEPLPGSAAFYRVRRESTLPLALVPAGPTLADGAVSLPDVEAGRAYTQAIDPRWSGTPPYTLAITGAPPTGVNVGVVSNGTPDAAVMVQVAADADIAVAAGERGRFEVSVIDGTQTERRTRYDLRVLAAAPVLTATRVMTKAGEVMDLLLAATGGTGARRWNLRAGTLPSGLALGEDGRLQGTPSVDAAEWNEDGVFPLSVEIADQTVDRITGAPAPRRTTGTLEVRVRLSYTRNLQARRPEGPSLLENCLGCHGAGFPPDLAANQARAILGVRAGTGGECASSWTYVVPGDPASSLLLQKVSAVAPCGDRMPQGGPFLEERAVRRLERWIRELTLTDTD